MRANPELIEDLSRYGVEDVQKCFNCGNCTAVCSLADDKYNFPRRSLHALQMGLEKKLESGPEPWLCYYCGECSTYCPRGAQPGETMMSLRRWLTSRYAQCERKRPSAIHLALMLSYVTMLILIMFFLGTMWSGPEIDGRVHVFGYLASIGLIGATIWALRGRIKKTEVHHQRFQHVCCTAAEPT